MRTLCHGVAKREGRAEPALDVHYFRRNGQRVKERGKSMERDELLKRISVDPEVCFGKPCVRGHRIWVSLILDLLASGMSVDEVLAQYPQLDREDILACLAYGAEMSRERFVEVPLERLS